MTVIIITVILCSLSEDNNVTSTQMKTSEKEKKKLNRVHRRPKNNNDSERRPTRRSGGDDDDDECNRVVRFRTARRTRGRRRSAGRLCARRLNKTCGWRGRRAGRAVSRIKADATCGPAGSVVVRRFPSTLHNQP